MNKLEEDLHFAAKEYFEAYPLVTISHIDDFGGYVLNMKSYKFSIMLRYIECLENYIKQKQATNAPA